MHVRLAKELRDLAPVAAGFGWKIYDTEVIIELNQSKYNELLASGLIDQATKLELKKHSTVRSLGVAGARLRHLTHLHIEASDFDDWESVYACKALKQLDIMGHVRGPLPNGISALSGLEFLNIRARITELPADLSLLAHVSLKQVRAQRGLGEQFREAHARQRGTLATLALGRFETWLRERAPDYETGLQPGLSDEQIDELEGKLDVVLPHSLRALYLWRDGHLDDRDNRFTFLRQCLSLQHAGRYWQELNNLQKANQWADGTGKQPPGVWSRHWFPFCRYDNGYVACVDLKGTYKGHRGQVVEVFLKDLARKVAASGLGPWFDRHLNSLKRGHVSHRDGEWESCPHHEDYEPGYPKEKRIRDRP